MFGRTRLERDEIQEIKYVFPVEYTWIPYVPVWIELAELQVASRWCSASSGVWFPSLAWPMANARDWQWPPGQTSVFLMSLVYSDHC